METLDKFRTEVTECLLVTLYKMSIIELKNKQAQLIVQYNPNQSQNVKFEQQLSFNLKEMALLNLLIGRVPNPEQEEIYPIYLELYQRVILGYLISPTIGAFTTQEPFIVSDISQIGFCNNGKIFLLSNIRSAYLSPESVIYKSLSTDLYNRLLLEISMATSQQMIPTNQPQANLPIEAQVPYGTPVVYNDLISSGLLPIYKFSNIIGYTLALFIMGSAIVKDELPQLIKDYLKDIEPVPPKNINLLIELGKILETSVNSNHVLKSNNHEDPRFQNNYFDNNFNSIRNYLEQIKNTFNLKGQEFCILFSYENSTPDIVYNISKHTEHLLDRCFGQKINPNSNELCTLFSKGKIIQIN